MEAHRASPPKLPIYARWPWYTLHVALSDGELTQLHRGLIPQPEAGIAHLIVSYAAAAVAQKKHTEAEPLLRQALAVRKVAYSEGDWRIAQVMSVLGASLAGQGKYTEAEPFLLDGYNQLKDNAEVIPDWLREKHIGEALQRNVGLYDAWNAAEPGKGYDAKAAEWRAKPPQDGGLKAAETARP